MKPYVWILISVVVVIFATIIGIIIATSGGSSKSSTQKNSDNTLVIWRGIDNDEVFKEAIKEYEEENPELKIKVVKKNLLDYELNSINALLSDDPPDIWSIPSSWVPRHKDKLSSAPTGFLADDPSKAKENLEANKKSIEESFAPIVTQDAVVDNDVFGLPLFVDTLALVVNPTMINVGSKGLFEMLDNNSADQPKRTKEETALLEQGPRYWSEFIKLSEMLTQKNGDKITRAGSAIGTTDNITNSADILATLMLQSQTQMSSSDQTMATFNLSQSKNTGDSYYPGREALDFYTKFANPSESRYTWNKDMPSDMQAFVDGKVAMIFAYSYQLKELINKNPGLKYAMLPLPQVEGADQAVDAGYYWLETVPKSSQHQEEAWNFLKYLVKSGLSEYHSFVDRPYPVLSDDVPTIEERIERKNPWTFAQQTAKSWYTGPSPKEVNTIFRNMIRSVNQGESITNAIDLAASKTTETYRGL